MPLVRLEVSNFKSYRGQQTIGPFKNFSCVIGPNGAGKSNVMDAISFVLGVKSAQLRSKQLKDLVYRGRKLGRAGDDSTSQSNAQDDQDDEDDDEAEEDGEGTARTAWVRAVYLDAAGQEHTFQRTVSVSGSSEYRVNDRVVTYSAYNKALEEHNILVKAKNFLVFQGDVEAIARQSPKELCKLIEQISGSLELASEYEKAKEAQDKASATTADNMHTKKEIAKEFKAYKEHKTEAAKLTKLRKEKDAAVTRHILWRLFHINEGIESATESIEAKNKELDKLRKETKSQEKKVESARSKQTKLQSEITKQEKVIKAKEKALEQEVPKRVALETRIAHAEKTIRNADAMIPKVEADERKKADVIKGLKADLARFEKAAKEAEDKQKDLTEQQGKALSDEDLNEYRQLKARASALLPDDRSRLDGARRTLKKLKTETTNLTDQVEQQERSTAKLSTDLEDLQIKKDAVERKTGELQTRRQEAQQTLDDAQRERLRIDQLQTESNEKLSTVLSRLQQANMDKKQTEKEAKIKDTISNLKRLFPGVHGRVIDLCKPTATKYQTAVTVVLGRNIDSIVIDSEATAIECINYLRTQRVGQATFIPLDAIQVKPPNDKYRTSAFKGARLAIDVIDFAPQVEAAMQHACGNSLVCDSMDIARSICYDRSQDVKAVTLEGTVIHKSGSITGGQSAQGNSRKWNDEDVAGLMSRREGLLKYLEELRVSRPKQSADESIVSEIARLDAQLVGARDDLDGYKLRLTGMKDELKHAREELKKSTDILTASKTKLNAAETEFETRAAVVNAAEDDVFGDFCARIGVDNIREYEELQLRAAQEQAEARVGFEKQITRLGHQIKFEEEQLASVQNRLRTLRTARETDTAAIDAIDVSKAELEESITAAEEEIAALREALEERATELEESRQALDDLKRTAGKSGKTLDRALKEISTWNDTIERLGVERATIYRRCKFEDIEIPLLAGSLNDVPLDAEEETYPAAMDVDEPDDGTQRALKAKDYKIEVDFSDLDDDERDNGGDEYAEEMESAIAKMEAEILRMAPNMKAAEKMGGVQAKLTETEKEVDRARKESTSARERFNSVRKQRSDLFNKAYTHISERIDAVYKDLTKGNASPMGGVAYLSLEDTEEPYLAGVKYHAMPPMKRFRDMDQLSGGEQTVAALALLFAIHSYQPAPFFVLDEVDAALDNTNVGRVARYLREHASDAFQFIVISLKDTLYSKSTSLVGVYRDQDENSSKSLTLDLEQYA